MIWTDFDSVEISSQLKKDAKKVQLNFIKYGNKCTIIIWLIGTWSLAHIIDVLLLTHAMAISSIKPNSVQNVDRRLILRWYVIIRTFSIEYRRAWGPDKVIKCNSVVLFTNLQQNSNNCQKRSRTIKTNPVVLVVWDSNLNLEYKKGIIDEIGMGFSIETGFEI